VQTVDLSSLGASDAEGPLVTALAWDGPDLLQIGTAGQGIASHFPSTGLVAVDPLRTGATVLSFPPLPPDADFAHRPAVLLAPPVAPGAGDDLAGDAPNVFASEARVAVLSFQSDPRISRKRNWSCRAGWWRSAMPGGASSASEKPASFRAWTSSCPTPTRCSRLVSPCR
jgi:hypothetical protein